MSEIPTKLTTLVAAILRATSGTRALYIQFGVGLALIATGIIAWRQSRHNISVEFYIADGYHFSPAEEEAVQQTADAATVEIRRLLPTLSHDLVLRVQPGRHVIPETGETGEPGPPNVVVWTVDPTVKGGVTETIKTQLRATLFHECDHLVRFSVLPSRSLMDEVIAEGMATVFERDYAGTNPPWGLYPDSVENWAQELMALPPDADHGYWLTQAHADGRRWIGMRTGAYIVDRAMRVSGQTSAQLVSTPSRAVIEMAFGK